MPQQKGKKREVSKVEFQFDWLNEDVLHVTSSLRSIHYRRLLNLSKKTPKGLIIEPWEMWSKHVLLLYIFSGLDK